MSTTVWSYGGGTQSVAIAVLILQGKLPRPDYVVMTDTGRERTRTWDYLRQTVQPALDAIRLTITVVSKDDYRAPDLYSAKEHTLLIPAFTTHSGRIGKLPTFCSKEWKSRIVRRYMVEACGVSEYDQWLGFSVDELERMKHNELKSVTNVYPLIDLRYSREMCAGLVDAFGWPAPPKSACWMCPNRADSNWLEMQRNDPDDFARAVALEREIQLNDPHVWLHGSGRPLDQVDFDAGQLDMFRGCSDEACMT